MIVIEAKPARGVLWPDEEPEPGAEYVTGIGPEGWEQFDQLGVSCIGVYDYNRDQSFMFNGPWDPDFQVLIDEVQIVAGFGIDKFDVPLLNANGYTLPPEKVYDLLAEIARELEREPMESMTVWQLAQINGMNITLPADYGLPAGVLASQGEGHIVANHCAYDVAAVQFLVDKVASMGRLQTPYRMVELRPPATVVTEQILNA